MNTCQTCKYWDREALFDEGDGMHYCKSPSNMFRGDDAGHAMPIITDPEFGCNQWEKMDARKQD